MQSGPGALRQRFWLLGLCCFPALNQLKLRFEVDAHTVEEWFDSSTPHIPNNARGVFQPIQEFGDTCAKIFKSANVEVGLYITTQLFSLLDASLPDINAEDLQALVDDLYDLEHNYVTFRAQVCQPNDCYAFRGMRLEMEHCGDIDGGRIAIGSLNTSSSLDFSGALT